MRWMILASLCLLPFAGAASAQITPRSIPDINANIVARTPGSLGVFQVQGDGQILHVQSGFRCPASLSSMSFWHAEVFSAAGTDVGCDYGRADVNGRSVAKLTLFLVKAAHRSLDQVFEGYKADITRSTPTMTYEGPAITVVGGSPSGSPFGEFRSAEFTGKINGVSTDNHLAVAIRRGWIVELRVTYQTDVRDKADIDNLAKDAASVSLVFADALRELEAASGPDI